MNTSPAPSPATRPGALKTVERALSDLRRGGQVLVRSRSREAAAIIMAAEMVTTESLSALRRLAGSRPMLAVTARRAAALKPGSHPGGVESVALPGDADPDFIRRLADPTAGPTPPLDRTVAILPEPEDSAAAAALALMKQARLIPAALVALVGHTDNASLRLLAQAEDLVFVDAEEIAAYPRLSASRLVKACEARVPLADVEETRIVAFRPQDGGVEHLAILIGRPEDRIAAGAPVLVRLHSQCFTGDLLGSLRCDCGDQLRGAIRAMAEEGDGILLYLAQEGRDIGLVNKLRAYQLQDLGLDTVDANEHLGFDADERAFAPAAEMLRQLGAQQVRLLTNNPEKVAGLGQHGIEVVERVAHSFPTNPHNETYLKTKAQRSGHLF
ncbi:MAG: GTP cyclohydrolase II [Alphaproteobacteria bacterium]|nr:GTP cyclohydrolase II [Alphaproteobacteria bacterium]MBU0798885.1 GTP cyclohydrolase II [Alphaproteobacteria bacterium]MBU0888735.1 GTP cyclohydrolase II [Alphaproteobacteria bacterium]MBU1813531.1 GTP cyclohydrolase II [Alphaproteobacteria bacterium]MBU2091750.1 GTP cyclohydrolase II [Alphaproteobacteria bacterium]